jgi:hypothetical protein
VLSKPVITAPIVGATKLNHLDDALASVNVKLSADKITSLAEPYVPHAVVGVACFQEVTRAAHIPLFPSGVDFCGAAASHRCRDARFPVGGRERALRPAAGARRAGERSADVRGRGSRRRLLLGRPGVFQYRSAIFPANPEQTHLAEAYIAQLSQARVFDAPVVTKIEPGRDFYPAEDYHQDFLTRNPRYSYIAINDLPKIENLKRPFPDLYRATPVLIAGARN